MDDAPEQLGNAGTPEERRTGIGGSDAPAALGMSPWRTPYDLWEEKIGLAPTREQTEPMLWGKLLEDTIRREYGRRTGFEVRQVQELIRHPEHPFMFAHIDGLITGAGNILEVKTARDARGWGEPETDEIPTPYLLQVHHYLSCTAAKVCDVAVLIGGQDFRIYQVRADAEIEQRLIEDEALFWESVTSRVPPAPSTLADAVKRWGHIDARGTVVAGETEQQAVAVLRRAHLLHKQIEQEEEAAKLILTAAMGDNGLNLVDPATSELLATWKLDNGRKAYSVEARAPQRRFLVKHLEEA